MNKHLRFRLSIILIVICALQILAFQNCSKNAFTDLGSQASQKESGNGGNYDGKISYVVEDLQDLCGDRSLVRGRIDRYSQSFQLVRENCKDITPVMLKAEDVNLDASEMFVLYQGQTYTLVRDPGLQPFRSDSLWNVSIGSGAQWSSSSDGDTLDLHTPDGDINAGSWSVPFFLSAAVGSRSVSATNLMEELLALPSDFHFAGPANGIQAFAFLDASKRWMYQYTACRTSGSAIICDYGIKDDTCGDGLGGFDLTRGLIRSWEIQKGEIRHALRFALPTSLNRPSGVVWPATLADFEGQASSLGRIAYGSTVGIPSDVNIDSLGLSRGGRILAKALQEYGAIQRDNSGTTGGINFFAEESAESLPEISEMRADLNKIIPVLKVLRNQSLTSLNGGGQRRQPPLPALDPAVCR